MDKEPIDKYGNGNCCPECGSIRITMHMQAVVYRDIDLKSGKDIIVVDEKIKPTPQRIKVHRYDNATAEGVGTWSYECRNCGWESESFAE